MLKIVEVHFDGEMVAYPVEAEANWFQEARKLAHTVLLMIKFVNVRNVQETDNLAEMLNDQWYRFIDFAEDNRGLVSDKAMDIGLALYHKTSKALP